MKQLNNAYNDYKELISILQLPHHGAKSSYNKKLLSMEKCMFYIASASKYNKKYLDRSILYDICTEGKLPFIVTEDMNTEVSFKYLIRLRK